MSFSIAWVVPRRPFTARRMFQRWANRFGQTDDLDLSIRRTSPRARRITTFNADEVRATPQTTYADKRANAKGKTAPYVW